MKLVKVEWLDAHGGVREGWRGLADITNRGSVPAISVGYLAKKDETRIVIIPHLISNDEKPIDYSTAHGDGELAIPTDWVQSITELAPKRKRK